MWWAYKHKTTPAEIEEAVALMKEESRENFPELYKFMLYRNSHHYGDQPALFLEEHTGFTEIAGKYQFPSGKEFNRVAMDREAVKIFAEINDAQRKACRNLLSDEDFEQVSAKALRTLTAMMNKLKFLNPQLEKGLKYDGNDPCQLCEVIQGITSGYNVDDINYYINVFSPAAHAIGSAGSDEALETALRENGHVIDTAAQRIRDLNIALAQHGFGYKGEIRWQAAPATLDKIEQKLAELKSRGGNVR